MAKQSFTKLNLKVNSDATTIYFNEYPIEVKQYLPISKKMEMIENIVKESVELNQNYYNPGLVETKQIFAIIENYTNLNFTEKQKEDFDKTYDILVSSGLARSIISEIDDAELNTIEELLQNSLKNVYGFHNSILGFLQMTEDSAKAVDSLKELFDKADFDLLKEVMAKMG